MSTPPPAPPSPPSGGDEPREPERAVRDEVHEAPTPAPGGMPLWAVRAVAFGLLATLLVVLGVQAKQRIAPPGPPAPSSPDQHVVVVAQRQLRLRVKVDDQPAFEKVLANGDVVDVTGKDRVEVDLPAAEAVKVTYNGETILPQGRQDEPRKLVFVDDLGT